MFQEGLNRKKYGLAVQENQVVGIVDPGFLNHTDSSEHTHFINFSRDAHHNSTNREMEVKDVSQLQ